MPVCTEHSGVCVNMDHLIKQTEANTQKIETLSDAVIKLTILVEDLAPKKKFWDADTKKYGLRLGFILVIVIITSLVGTNILAKLDLTQLIK